MRSGMVSRHRDSLRVLVGSRKAFHSRLVRDHTFFQAAVAKEAMILTVAGCPKPLSRKKLRQLMPHNHPDLTGPRLAGRFGRAPGGGRYKAHLRDEAERLEVREQMRTDSNILAGTLTTALHAIRKLLAPRVKAKRVAKAA